MRAAEALAQTGKLLYTLSERRHTHEKHLKFVATLQVKQNATRLNVLNYQVVDATPGFQGGSPEHTARLTRIEQHLKKVYLNHPVLINRKDYPYEIARLMEREADKILKALRELPYTSRQDTANREKLQLTYLHDTLFSLAYDFHSVGLPYYDKYFETLTLNTSTGLLPLKAAADLLITQHLTDRATPAEITAAVSRLKTREPKRKLPLAPPKKEVRRKGNTI